MIVQTTLLVYVSPMLSVSLPFLIAIVFLIQRYYLKVSRVLRLLDLQSRAQVLTSFIETVSTTIDTMNPVDLLMRI